MKTIKINDLILPLSLRSELKEPMGYLIEGTIEETTPKLIEFFENYKGYIITVGDVISEITVRNSINPHIIITDGYTKREKISEIYEYINYDKYDVICQAAEITKQAWKMIRQLSNKLSLSSRYHLFVAGEEDLLVLPLLVELPDNSIILYGQPNTGVVLREVTTSSRIYANKFLSKMEKK